ncbi:MAG: FAD-binding oxidoreductase, partial [Spirochaetales bacterium]|nr:FAD-binding oxidoreductase [Spirochaetales bacterium]
MKKKTSFTPGWRETPPSPGPYRSMFKWGDPNTWKHPNSGLYRVIKECFGLTDEDFSYYRNSGDKKVELSGQTAPGIPAEHVTYFTDLLGSENVSLDAYERVFYSYGKSMEEAKELREGRQHHIADAVLHPKSVKQVEQIVSYCSAFHIPLIPFGWGSTVNLGVSAPKGGVVLVLKTHLNKVVKVNEMNKTATVQAGISGSELEQALNHAAQLFGTRRNYTNGHFPQSFEYSSVGGWIVTCGAGQESSYYGDAIDLVLSQTWVTPKGTFTTDRFPASATGPKIDDLMKGSEGTFGILVEVVLKIFYHQPNTKYPFGYIFPSWEQAKEAVREISQGEFGLPGVFRLSDPEETGIGLKLYHIEGTALDTIMKVLGYKEGQRCLLLARSCGEQGFAKHVRRKAGRICRSHKGLPLTGYPVRKWDKSRYLDPYKREVSDDFVITIDTMETRLTWDSLE